jgi:hypothetical protein
LMHIDRRHSMYNVHYCILCPVVYDSSAHFVYIDKRENKFMCITLYQWFSTWPIWSPGGHSNLYVGHLNFTA